MRIALTGSNSYESTVQRPTRFHQSKAVFLAELSLNPCASCCQTRGLRNSSYELVSNRRSDPKTCPTKLTAHRAKDSVELRKRLHLMTEKAIPKHPQSLFFFENAIFKAGDVLLSESKLFCNCPNHSRKVHSSLDREKPEIIEISRFIPRRIGKRDDLLGRDLVQTVSRNRAVFGQVFEFRIGAQERTLFDCKAKDLRDGDVDLTEFGLGSRP